MKVKLTPDVSLIAAPLEPAAPPALSSEGPAAGDCSLSPPTPPVCPPAWSSLSPPPPPFPPVVSVPLPPGLPISSFACLVPA